MAISIRIPRLYPEMEEATVGRWIVKEGEPVEPRSPIVEIITDKVSYEVEAPETPDDSNLVLLLICAAEKSVLPVDSIVGVLGGAAEDRDALPDWQAENKSLAEARQSALGTAVGASLPSATAAPGPGPALASAGTVRATPAARRSAKAAGVSLEDVAATAAGATVTEEDVANYLKARS